MSKRRDHSLQFKIALMGVRPPIWRRIRVPAGYTFWDLHVAIQDAMGWLDYHLHEFEIRNPVDRRVARIGIPDDDSFSDQPELLPGWAVPVVSYFTLSNRSATYLYDFGDDWRHSVVLEEIAPLESPMTLPECLAGRRRCPPEDCGGIGGYESLLEILADPSHEDHEDTLTWVGGSFDPEGFDKAAVRFDDPDERWRRAFDREPEEVVPEPIRVGVDERVPVAITLEERQLVTEHTLADPELTDRLRMGDFRDGELQVGYTLSELDELLEFIAAAANHAGKALLERKLDALYEKLSVVESRYRDEPSPGAR